MASILGSTQNHPAPEFYKGDLGMRLDPCTEGYQRRLDGLSLDTTSDIKFSGDFTTKHSDPKYKCAGGNDTENETPQARLSTLESENKLLKKKYQEAIQSKTKWQSYDRSRDELVNRLETEKRQLQARLSQVKPSDLISSERDDIILYWQRKAEEEETTRKTLEEVNKSQDVLIRNLQHALQQAQRTASQAQQAQRTSRHQEVDTERLEILENQVKIFSEDFEQERRDRERAQARNGELEDKLRLTELQLSQFQDDTMTRLSARRRHTMESYRAEYERQMSLNKPSSTSTSTSSSRLIPHGVYDYSMPETDGDLCDEDCIDVPMAHSQPSQQTNNQYTLECPKCPRKFLTSDPMSFLEHTEVCS